MSTVKLIAEPTCATVSSEQGSPSVELGEGTPAEPDAGTASQAAANRTQPTRARMARFRSTFSASVTTAIGGSRRRHLGGDSDLRKECGQGSTMLVRPEVVERVAGQRACSSIRPERRTYKTG